MYMTCLARKVLFTLLTSIKMSVLLSSSSTTTYVLEEDEPDFLEAIDYSAESNDEDAEAEIEQVGEIQEIPDQLSDSETNHRE